MESKFYIGQKVIALRNSISDNTIKKDAVYTVLEIKQMCCMVCIRVTDSNENVSNFCVVHRQTFIVNGKFFDQNAFAPIEEQSISSMTYEDAIELVTEKELVT